MVAIGFAVSMLVFTNVKTTISFTRFDSPGIDIGNVAWAIMAVVVIYAMTNAVNLTDGLDGLAAGSSIFAFAAYTVIAFWGFRHIAVYSDESFLDTAVVAAAMLGGVRRVPVVERGAGPDLHGRHRFARHRRRPRLPGPQHQHGAAPARSSGACS